MPRHHHKKHTHATDAEQTVVDSTEITTEAVAAPAPEAVGAVEPRLDALQASFKSSVQTSCSDLNAMSQPESRPLAALKNAVMHNDVVVAATTALSEVVEKIAAVPAVSLVSERLTSARATLTDAVHHLREFSAHALSAVPEQAVVKRALEALERAHAALNSLKQTAIDDAHFVQDGVLHSVHTARAIATDAVQHAKTYVEGVQDRITARAHAIVDDAHGRAVAAARKAGELDTKYHVVDRVTTLGQKLHVPKYAAAAEALVKDLDAKYDLQDKVTAVFSKAQGVDNKVTSGKGTALFNWGKATAERTLAYAATLLQEYKTAAAAAAGEEVAASGSTGTASSLPSAPVAVPAQ